MMFKGYAYVITVYNHDWERKTANAGQCLKETWRRYGQNVSSEIFYTVFIHLKIVSASLTFQ